jgi:hypothetical protein
MDLKEAAQTAAPRASSCPPIKPSGSSSGRHLSPYLGKRMRAIRLMNKSVFLRELLPQDLKVEVEQLTR